MATSPNYGWSEPDNSSLVKNGAADIRTLGDAIDTSVWNIGFGQAGKNKIINSDFSVNQRNFTSTTTSGTFGFDRYRMDNVDGTVTWSAQAFAAGAAPVAGYEAANFLRCVTTGQTLTTAVAAWINSIEDVRTFAGQTVTLSFWAKAATGTPKIAFELRQLFGSGGSAEVTNYVGQSTISTSWQRYSLTVTLPSLTGKTIGTSSNLRLNVWYSGGSTYDSRTGSIGIQSNTFDIWGIQLEAGSKATPFQTATGTIQGELAACQRYYVRFTTPDTYSTFGIGGSLNSTQARIQIPLPVTMRTKPSSVEYSSMGYSEAGGSVIAISSGSSLVIDVGNDKTVGLVAVVSSGLTQYRAGFLYTNNSTSAYVGLNAEL